MNIFGLSLTLVDMIIPTFLLLVVGVGIMAMSNSDHIEALAISKELSYISSMVSDSDVEVAINYQQKDFDKFNINYEKNSIQVETSDKIVSTAQEYFGNNLKIEENNKQVRLSS